MGNGSIGYGAAQGLETLLSRLFQEQQEKRRAAEAQEELELRRQTLAEGKRRTDLDERRLTQVDPEKPVVVGGRLVMPSTGRVVYEPTPESKPPIEIGGRLIDPVTLKPLYEPPPTPEKPPSPMEVNQGNTVIDPATGRVIFTAPSRPTGGAGAGPGAATGPSTSGARAFAEMVAKAPSILQRATPTVFGETMQIIASDPALQQTYETTRMAPLREQATTMLSALDQLVTVDEKTGKVVGLTPGAQSIFGELMPPAVRGYYPGKDATDANAALQQVIGQQVVDMIADMKAQSRTGATGFGAMNERELDILMSAATQLTRRLSEDSALQQLVTMREKLQKIIQPGAAELGPPQTTRGQSSPLAVSPEAAQQGMRAGGGTVRMKAPNGQIKVVQPADVERYKAGGAVVVP